MEKAFGKIPQGKLVIHDPQATVGVVGCPKVEIIGSQKLPSSKLLAIHHGQKWLFRSHERWSW